MALKGDAHAVFNNTLFDIGKSDILIRQSYTGENANTYLYNNLCMDITGNQKEYQPVTGIKGMEGNYIYTGQVPLQDPEKRDFYPLAERRADLTGVELPADLLIPVELDSTSVIPYTGAYGYS